MEFVVECRYQYRAFGGVEWTDWYIVSSKHIPEEEIKAVLKEYSTFTKSTDRITKLKHEYRAKDAAEYEREYQQFLERVEYKKKDFATIKRIKKPWKRKKKVINE